MKKTATRAFSLVELLICLAIVAILTGLAIPAVMRGRESMRQVHCSNNLRQIGTALTMHHDAYDRYPPGVNWTKSNKPFLSWAAHLYPYLEREELWEMAIQDYGRAWIPFDEVPHAGFAQAVSVFSCPTDGRADQPRMSRGRYYAALTNYLGVLGTDVQKADGVLFADSRIALRHIRDGTSNTIMVGERPPSQDYCWGWLYAGAGFNQGSGDMILGVAEVNVRRDLLAQCPLSRAQFQAGSLENPCHVLHYWSMHPAGAYFLYCDGSVRFQSYGSARVVAMAATRNGRE